MNGFAARLGAATAARPLLLDGPLGTELARRGANLAPPLWSARSLDAAPDAVRAVHAENVSAGADVLTACTFRTHARNLEAAGLANAQAEARRRTRLAVALAREAASGAGRAVFVAGSAAPLEDCWRPDLVPHDAALDREHGAHAENLREAGADFVLVETMGTAREGRAAVRAAAAAGLPAAVSFTTDEDGRLLSGEPLARAAGDLLDLAAPPVAIGVNCVPARRVLGALEVLAAAAPGLPLLAYANAGRALDEAAGLYPEPVGPDAYAELARTWLAAGARLVGSCCGTSAAHVAALADLRGSTRGSCAP